MYRRILVAAIWVALVGTASADEDNVSLGRFKPTASGFAGVATTTAANELGDKDPSAGDTDLVWYRRYCGRPIYTSYGFYGWGARSYCRPAVTFYYRPSICWYYPAPVYVAPVYYYHVPVISNPVIVTTALARNAPSERSLAPLPNATYTYNGGPKTLIPQPNVERLPQPKPVDQSHMSISTKSAPKYQYPAFGEK
jgi:hypothetical protein